jgi:hypothetical protein
MKHKKHFLNSSGMTKIEINRRFAPTDERQLSDPDYLSFFGEKPEGVREWSELLSASPVVILGEGRSGKTYEFLRQVEKLRAEQKFAFFLPLERLYDEAFEDALEVEDLKLFQLWQKSPDDEGYFFLDALDELKLREGSMRKAIKKLQAAISGHIGRASIILSCRPADWKSTTDRPYLVDFCQPKNQNVQKQSDDAEASFLEIISKDDSVISDKIPCDESATINRTQIQW